MKALSSLLYLATLLILSSFSTQEKGDYARQFVAYNIGCDSIPNEVNFKIIKGSGSGFGYDILVGKKLLIHQPTIPGLPGNKGFVSKKDAEKVAGLVVKKIQKGIMPPAIEKKELDELKINYK